MDNVVNCSMIKVVTLTPMAAGRTMSGKAVYFGITMVAGVWSPREARARAEAHCHMDGAVVHAEAKR